jgi:hypothetical protein
MKAGKKKPLFYILGYLMKLIMKIWWSGNFFFEIWRIGSFFFPSKILCVGLNHIFQIEIWLNFALQKKKGSLRWWGIVLAGRVSFKDIVV